MNESEKANCLVARIKKISAQNLVIALVFMHLFCIVYSFNLLKMNSTFGVALSKRHDWQSPILPEK